MSIVNKILTKLGLKKDEEGTESAQKEGTKSAPVKRYPPSSEPGTPRTSNVGKDLFEEREPAPEPMEMVDVRSKLENMAKGTNLDWKVSIVDLLKVLGIDSSLEAREELARELGAPQDVMQDNVKMNVWLHKKVLAKIAQNGGNVPPELLD